MKDYPLPSYAASIWIAGDHIWLGLPSPDEGVRSHSVSFPNSERGLQVALAVLREREKSPTRNWIGTKGAPTKCMIEEDLKRDAGYNEMLRAMNEGKKVSEAEKAEAVAFLEELGL